MRAPSSLPMLNWFVQVKGHLQMNDTELLRWVKITAISELTSTAEKFSSVSSLTTVRYGVAERLTIRMRSQHWHHSHCRTSLY